MKTKGNGVTVAQSAGFCPGVKRAIERVLELEAEGKTPIYTIGPLIHNNQVTADLEQKGIHAIDSLEEAKDKNGVLVIRAHGITPQFQQDIENFGMKVIDATCPLVKNAHNLISEYAKQGYDTVIVGDVGHAEVIGLVGYAQGRAYVVADAEEAQKLPPLQKAHVVSQTTQKEETFYAAAQAVKNKAEHCVISNTICYPTKQRQQETLEKAKEADLVIVVGGRHSANTARLAKLCAELCPKVLHIESAKELKESDVTTVRKIFITAGASTPNWVIEGVVSSVKNMRKAKVTLQSLAQSVVEFLVRSYIYTSFAAVCLTYVCMKLQGARNNFYIYALSGCFVYTLTLANRGEHSYIKKSRLARIIIGALLTCFFAYGLNIYIFIPVFIFLLLGLLYPYRHKFKGFTALRGTRDIVTALGWCFVCACVPALEQGLIFTKAAWLALSYGALLVFIRSVILSIGTEHKDILLSQESFYKAFGVAKTKAAIAVIILGLTVVLAQLILMGWKHTLALMLLLGLLYTVVVAAYFYGRARPRTVLSDAVVDGQFYLLALLAFGAVNFI